MSGLKLIRLRLFLLISSCFVSTHYIAQNNQFVPLDPPSRCSASPEPIIVTQPDSTEISIVGKGDMNNHWTETVDGYSISLNRRGIYEYAQKVNGILQASGVKANDPNNRTVREINYLNRTSKHIKPDLNPLKASILNRVNAQLTTKAMPTTGKIKVLALLIDYPDLQSTFSKNDLDSVLTDTTNSSVHGSFKTYYKNSSGKQLQIEVDVMGWYRADSSFVHYGRDSGFARAADLVREAVDAAEVAGVNYANYDNDNDGRVDGILAIHAGQGAEQGSQTQFIWSHRWVLAGGNSGSVTYDGVIINDYTINPEITVVGRRDQLVGIGVFAHEFGHNLGLPDLYDTDQSNGDSRGIATWGVMASGTWLGIGYTPGDFCAWSKEELGWVKPQLLTIGNSGNYSLQPTSRNIHQIFRINTSLSNEYFLLENRQRQGLDTALRGNGLAIWHINTNKTNSFRNDVNADHRLKGVDLEEADGFADLDSNLNSGDAGDLFPGSSSNTSFDDSSNPDAKFYTLASSGLIIRNIQEIGDVISFGFGKAPGPPCNGFTTLTAASGKFDDGSDSLDYAHNQNCSWLIQPPSGTITLSFSAFNTQSGRDTLNVYDGIDSTANLLGSFSGNQLPPTITSSGNSLFVQFISDSTISFSGWKASYTGSSSTVQLCGNDTLTASSATFDDGSDSSSTYASNSQCSWLIQPPNATQINLSFNRFETEAVFDFLKVYDGNSNAGTLLATISGSTNPNPLTANSGEMFLEFVSDSAVELNGWEVSYTSVIPKILEINPDSMFFSGSGSLPQTASITSNLNWSIRATVPWVSSNPSSGSMNGTATISVQNNNSGSLRRGFIVLNDTAGSLKDSILVIQDTSILIPNLSLNPDSITLAQPMGSSASFTVNSNLVWTTQSGATWLTVNNPPSTKDTNTVQVVANSMNNNPSIRSTFVAVQDVGGNFFDTVYVSQMNGSLMLSPSTNSISLASDSGSNRKIGLNANINWTASSGVSWLTVSPTSGSGNDSLTISSLSENTSSADRNSFIALSGQGGNITDTIFVRQFGQNNRLSVAPKNLVLAQAMGSNSSFTVNSNVEWQILSGAGWLTASGPAVLRDTGNVLVTANSANPTNNIRSTYVAVQSLNGSLTDTVIVQQFGNNPALTVNPDSLFLAGVSGTNGVIQVSSNTIWKVSSNANWFDLQPDSGNGSKSISITTNSNNTGTTIRTAMLRIEDSFNNLVDSVIIIQDTVPSGLTLSKDTLRLSAAAGSLERFDIITQSAWTAVSNTNWLDVTPSNGLGNLTATALARTANTSINQRLGSITVSTSGNSETIIVIQEGVNPFIEAKPSAINLNFTAGSNDVISVQSNIKWKANNPVNWLSINPDSGNENGSINITANTANNSGAIRTATLTISGDGVNDQRVTVNQIDGSNPIFTVSRDTVYLDQEQGSTSDFSILSNVDNWELEENTAWFLINPTTGSNTETVTVLAASKNVFGNIRSGEIRASRDSFPDRIVTVVQRSANPIFQISPAILTLGPNLGDSTAFNLSSNLTSWVITENASWMETNPSLGSFSNTITVLATEANESGNIRSEVITISAPPLVPQSILVTQDTNRITSVQNIIQSESQEALVYPNPNRGQLHLVLSKEMQLNKQNLQVLNMLGSEVNFSFQRISDTEYRLDISGNNEGIYFLRINNQGKIFTKKISLIR